MIRDADNIKALWSNYENAVLIENKPKLSRLRTFMLPTLAKPSGSYTIQLAVIYSYDKRTYVVKNI